MYGPQKNDHCEMTVRQKQRRTVLSKRRLHELLPSRTIAVAGNEEFLKQLAAIFVQQALETRTDKVEAEAHDAQAQDA